MWLSENFHLSEFTSSQEAVRKGIRNIPTEEHIRNLEDLCVNVLEPVRFEFGPVRISSGFRSPALNKAIKGSPTSQHVYGLAADIEIPDVDNCDLAAWIADNLIFDQLILEFHIHEDGPNSGWVHVSYCADNREEILTANKVNGKTVYSRGLPF